MHVTSSRRPAPEPDNIASSIRPGVDSSIHFWTLKIFVFAETFFGGEKNIFARGNCVFADIREFAENSHA